MNLAEYMQEKTRCFFGKDEWQQARKQLNLDQFDQEEGAVVYIIIPDQTEKIASLFFQGLFAESVKVLGETEFRKRYHVVYENRYPIIDSLQQDLEQGLRFVMFVTKDVKGQDWEKMHRHSYFQRKMRDRFRVVKWCWPPVIIALGLLWLLYSMGFRFE